MTQTTAGVAAVPSVHLTEATNLFVANAVNLIWVLPNFIRPVDVAFNVTDVMFSPLTVRAVEVLVPSFHVGLLHGYTLPRHNDHVVVSTVPGQA